MSGLRTITARAKRWTKPAVTGGLLALGYYRWRRRRLSGSRAVILVYHHVTAGKDATNGWSAPFQRGVPRGRFEHHMRFLRRAMLPLSLRDVVAAVQQGRGLPPRSVVVTFDDGYLDNFTVAYPILRKYEIPATVFVATGFVQTQRRFWWDQVYAMLRHTPMRLLEGDRLASIAGADARFRPSYPLTTRAGRLEAADALIEALRTLSSDDRDAALAGLASALGLKPAAVTDGPPMMTWAQLQAMSRTGVAVESHTHTHPILGLADAGRVEEELSTSKRLIEQHLDQPVQGLAYPDGRRGTYTETIMKIARALGFRFGCTTTAKPVGPGIDLFGLGRMPVDNVSFPVFVRELLQVYAAR